MKSESEKTAEAIEVEIECAPSISDVVVEVQGNAGPSGPQGPEGPKGEKGDTGATGAQGPQGYSFRKYRGTLAEGDTIKTSDLSPTYGLRAMDTVIDDLGNAFPLLTTAGKIGAQVGTLTPEWSAISGVPIIDGVAPRDLEEISHFAKCTTAADVAEKAVSVPGFKLVVGARLLVNFQQTNSAAPANLKIKVNDLNAVAIKWRNATLPTTDLIKAGSVWEFVFDGTDFKVVCEPDREVIYQALTTEAGELPILLKGTANPYPVTTLTKFAAGITFNPSTGTLTTTMFKGALSGNAATATAATRATQDASGNVITTTYAKKTELTDIQARLTAVEASLKEIKAYLAEIGSSTESKS